jgi:hypothetical protein
MELQRYALLVFIMLSGALGVQAHAAPITGLGDPAYEQVFWAEYQCCSTPATYDAATETFSLSTTFGPGAFISPGFTFIFDLIGNYDLTAHVDHSGNVLGGTFSLVGQSVLLGVPASQALISGTITGAAPTVSGSGFINSLVADVTYFNPLLEAFGFATPTAAILSSPGMPCFCTTGISWAEDNTFTLVQPDIFGFRPVAVAEPITLPLFAIGVLAVAWVTRKGRRAS